MTSPGDRQPPLLQAQERSQQNLRALEERLLVHAFARLRPLALGVALGTVTAAGLFLATAILLVRAAIRPADHQAVGPLLGLLRNYFPGFSVTWSGAVVGLGYGFALGFVLGVMLALSVNLNHRLHERRLNRSRARFTAER